MTTAAARNKNRRKCPICGRPKMDAFAPFCSKHCADTDLARWLKGHYAIPGEPAEPEKDPDEPAKPQ